MRLILNIESLLDHLITSTLEDHSYGRGFNSYYPDNCLSLMKTMKFGIQLEIETYKGSK